MENRYADFPLALGEWIMINHALFAGLPHAGATPLTDDAFHSKANGLKPARAARIPALRKVLEDRTGVRQVKVDLLAATTLPDAHLKLPILSAEMPLEEVLEYRRTHGGALQQASDKLASVARPIEAEPWSERFWTEVETKTIPNVSDELAKVRQARDDWLASGRGHIALKAAKIVGGAATAALNMVVTPLTPVGIATAAGTLAAGAILPGAEWLLDWRDSEMATQENGLHYLLLS